MEEQLISFETAKLAKEVGFPQYREGVYYTKDKEHCLVGWGFDNIREYSAPTQSLLQKWLREVHNIDVYCIPWVYENKRVYDFFINYEGESRAYSSYEKALEIGLQEALKLIK